MWISKEGKFAPFITFDIRGGELVSWTAPEKGLIAYGLADEDGNEGTKFEVDLSEGEFADYDEARECEVTLYSYESEFEKTK